MLSILSTLSLRLLQLPIYSSEKFKPTTLEQKEEEDRPDDMIAATAID